MTSAPPLQAPAPTHELSWEEIAAAIFRDRGITTGFWRIGVKLHFAALTGEWPQDGGALPTGLVGMGGFALFEVGELGPMVFDAAAGKRVRKAAPSAPPQTTATSKAPKRTRR